MINRRSMWPDQEDRCRGSRSVDLGSLSSTQSGEPDAGCQLPPRVYHGGTHRLTLGLPSPGVAVGVGDVLLWGNPSGEASSCRPYRALLRCDPDRRPSQTAACRGCAVLFGFAVALFSFGDSFSNWACTSSIPWTRLINISGDEASLSRI